MAVTSSTYLVTGVAGFIGARVAGQLLAGGHQVVGVDNLNDYYDTRMKDYRLSRLLGEKNWQPGSSATQAVHAGRGRRKSAGRNFTFASLDIENLAGLRRLFKDFQFDAVFNLAARAGVPYSLENPHVYFTTNTLGTLNILECQRHHGVKKLVLASTSSLYAGCPMPFAETLPVNTPLSPYAASKKAAEVLAYTYHKTHGLDVTVLRYFTVFGPAGRPDMSIFRFIQALERGRAIELHGDGRQTRDFTYVDDIARGTIAAARPLGFEIINLGGGRQPTTMREVIQMLETGSGRRARIKHVPASRMDIKDTRANIARARRLLGWRPEVSLAAGLAATLAWHRENQAWVKRLVA